MEDKDKRIGWLRKLKVGDKVIVNGHYHTAIRTVDKITPTGRIIVNEISYNHAGWEIGDKWHINSLSEWSQEFENEFLIKIEFKKMCKELSDAKWLNMDFESVKKVYDVYKSL